MIGPGTYQASMGWEIDGLVTDSGANMVDFIESCPV